MTWCTGDVALIRYRGRGPISYLISTRVVDDRPELTTLYTAPGYPMKRRIGADGTFLARDIPYAELHSTPIVIGDIPWQANHVLRLIRPEDAHDISLFWAADDWTFRGWYVNLQDPVRRTSVGFDSADHVLDIQVTPDGAWTWKDEDEFADAITVGRFTPDRADEIRREGERVIARIEAGGWPFDAGYETWRPDPSWPVPVMLPNWDVGNTA